MSTQSERPKKSIEVRRMVAADIPDAIDIERGTPGAPRWNLQDYERCVRESPGPLHRRAWIAASDEGMLGFAVASGIAAEDRFEWELESLAVRPEFHRRGIGQKLMTTMIFDLKVEGATKLMLEVRASNLTALRLYERLGMARNGIRKGYYRGLAGKPAEDSLLMELSF